jgi:hypothetical protein
MPFRGNTAVIMNLKDLVDGTIDVNLDGRGQ